MTPRSILGRLLGGCAVAAPVGVPEPEGSMATMRSSSSYASIGENLEGAKRGFHSEYSVLEKLGEGGYGTVWATQREKDESGAELAVKVMNIRPLASQSHATARRGGQGCRFRRSAAREVAALSLVGPSPHVIGFIDVFVEPGLVYILLERCEQTLVEHLECVPDLTELSFKPILRQMLCGISATHAAGVVHRDVKPDNFLCHRGVVKLCDFGLACHASSAERFEIRGAVGTPAFMAPDMLSGEPYSGHVDVWSLGVVGYVIFFGRFPYQPADNKGSAAMIQAIRSGYPRPCFRSNKGSPATASRGAVRFLQTLLCRQPGWRPTSSEALNHRFFTSAKEDAESASAPLAPMLLSAARIGAFARSRSAPAAPPAADGEVALVADAGREPRGTLAEEGDDRQRRLAAAAAKLSASESTRDPSSPCSSTTSI